MTDNPRNKGKSQSLSRPSSETPYKELIREYQYGTPYQPKKPVREYFESCNAADLLPTRYHPPFTAIKEKRIFKEGSESTFPSFLEIQSAISHCELGKLFGVPYEQLGPNPLLPDVRKAIAGLAGESGTDSLLYLNSNNSAETSPETPKQISELALQTANLLTNYHAKQAFTLASNVDTLVSNCKSVNHVVFLTLTFPDHVVDFKEGSRRFDIFRKHVLDKFPNFGIWLRSTERQGSGRIHYHLLVETKKDVRTGFDWEKYNEWIEKRQAFRKKGKRFYGKCPTGNDALRELWKIIMDNRTKYGFGMAEILPIRTNAEAMSKYVGKYISKHIGAREDRDKGMRLITYSQGWMKNSVKISWYSQGSCEWRRKTQKFVNYVIGSTGSPERDHYMMGQRFTKRWVWRFRDDIFNIDHIVSEQNKQIPF